MARATDIEGLDCEASVLEGALVVLRARLEEMCALREGALDWSDIEGVHAMRVASRRLRSAVKDFLPLLPEAIPRKRLKAIADALGRVRDEDVAIEALEKLRAKAKEEVAEEIERFTGEHRSRREGARATLEAKISEEALSKFKKRFTTGLEEAMKASEEKGAQGRRAKTTGRSFRQVGRKTILSRFNELHQLSRSLYQPFETEPLHRMRIAAKRLRYAMELFSPCWPDKIGPFAQEIAELQKSLGELHDCDIWIAGLGARLDALHREEIGDEAVTADVHARQRRAAIWLFRYFVKERIKHFRATLARWHKWETTAFFTRLSACLEAAPVAADDNPS